MTTTISYATSNGRRVRSTATDTYATAYAGSNLTVLTGSPHAYGIGLTGATTRNVNEVFDEYAYTLPSDELVVAAHFQFVHSSSVTPSSPRDLEVRTYDWGASVTTGDWRTQSQYAALPILATVQDVQAAGSSQVVIAAGDALLDRLETTGTVKTVTSTHTHAAGNAPSEDCQTYLASVDASGTASDPCLVYTTVARNSLAYVAGAQVQLSDGTWVGLETNAPAVGVAPTVSLVHHDGTTRTVEATVPTGTSSSDFATPVAMQALALVVDDLDNLYVLGQLGSSPNNLAAKAYVKGVGYSWTAGTMRSSPMSSYGGQINNVVGAWHDVGTSGTIVAICSHSSDTATGSGSTSGQVSYGLLSCDRLLTDAGSLLRESGNAAGIFVSSGAGTAYNATINDTGFGLDIAASSATRGYVICHTRSATLGAYNRVSQCRYVLNSSGTGVTSSAFNTASSSDTWGTKDAGGKLRVLAIGDTSYIVVAVDQDTGFGAHPVVVQNIGTSSTFTLLGEMLLDSFGPADMPAPATLAVSPAWDTLYDPVENTLWVYYLDSADSNRLLRTEFDLNSMLPSGTAIEVDAAVGAAGSTVRAIRVARGANPADEALVTCAVRSSGGAHSTVYVLDTFNQAPSSPTLTPKANYDATAAGTFAWTFVDPNPGDTQSAYQLQITTSAGTAVYDSGKVTSSTSSHNLTGGTLTNGNSYQWRARTYDAADVVGEWSGYSPFSTSAGGAVTVTVPSTDNPAGVITDDYTISWSVTGTTQAGYRITLVRNDTAATISDTGWVTSTATSALVSGMVTDVEHTISVKVRNAGLVESGTGTRLITPSFGAPEVPVVTLATSTDGGYIEVTVSNPAPTGDRPEVSTNLILRRESGSTGDYLVVGSADPDGSFRDYSAASGVEYEYVARGTV